MTKADKIGYWKKLHDYDFRTDSGLFEKKYYPYTLYFLHLSIEKLLKAIYIKINNTDPIRTHNLTLFAQKCNLELSNEQWDLLAELNEFNIESRYPEYKMSLYETAKKKYTSNYLDRSKEIRKWLKKKL